MLKFKKYLNRKSIVLICLLFGYGWILLTDLIAKNFSYAIISFHQFEVIKGLIFVTIASSGLYGLLYLRDQKLEESQEFADSILETANVGIALIEESGVLMRVNNTFARMFGYEKEDLVGEYFTRIIPEHPDINSRQAFTRLLKGAENYKREWTAIDSKGNEIKVLIDTSVLEEIAGRRYLVVSVTDITNQKKNQQKLLASLKEKRVLLTEIHHRVKNNLAIVASFLQLQKFNTDDSELIKALSDSEMQIHSMAMIHEKLYESKSLTHIPMDEYIRDLIDSIKRIRYKKIDLEVQSDCFNLNVNQAIPCALILNELISNAFEHAYKDDEEGLISINTVYNYGVVNLTVTDDGCGLPVDFQLSGAETYGYSIINALVKQLEADISIDSELGLGTEIAISFKKSEMSGSTTLLEDREESVMNIAL